VRQRGEKKEDMMGGEWRLLLSISDAPSNSPSGGKKIEKEKKGKRKRTTTGEWVAPPIVAATVDKKEGGGRKKKITRRGWKIRIFPFSLKYSLLRGGRKKKKKEKGGKKNFPHKRKEGKVKRTK